MHIIYSKSSDVFHNLAVEDAMLDDERLTLPVVYIYRNDNAVVLGKNQNPWRECATDRLSGYDVQLARRVTGGGTVFHDPGNINVSCILPRESYDRCAVLNWTINAMRLLGLEAELVNDTSIVVDGKKISGNAFCYRRNKVLHHGTLLWDADLDTLRKSLQPTLANIKTRAIESVRMDVINLKSLLAGSTQEDVIDAVVESLGNELGMMECDSNNEFEPDGLTERIDRMQSWKWLYGNTPDFTWSCDVGDGEWVFDVHRGMVRGVEGTDRRTHKKLSGLIFSQDSVSKALGHDHAVSKAFG